MSYKYHISPEDYEQAALNGIKRRTLEWRVRDGGWDMKRATTIPPRKLNSRPEWVKIATENGIPYQIFINRVSAKWALERAATEPLWTNEKRIEQMKKHNPAKRKYPEKLIKQAESIGISRRTFYARVNYGWPLDKSVSTPLVPPGSQSSGVDHPWRTENGLLFMNSQERKYVQYGQRH